MDKSAIPGALTTFPFPFLSLVPYEDVAVIPPRFTSQFVHGLFPDFLPSNYSPASGLVSFPCAGLGIALPSLLKL